MVSQWSGVVDKLATCCSSWFGGVLFFLQIIYM